MAPRTLVRLVAAVMMPRNERKQYDKLNNIGHRKFTRDMHQTWLMLRRKRLNAKAELRTYLRVYLGLNHEPRLFSDDDFDEQIDEDYERIAKFLLEINARPPCPDPASWATDSE